MAQPNVIYNCQALYVGPAPETGYNFCRLRRGSPTNDFAILITGKINRLHSVDRIQSVSYDINVPHTDITSSIKGG